MCVECLYYTVFLFVVCLFILTMSVEEQKLLVLTYFSLSNLPVQLVFLCPVKDITQLFIEHILCLAEKAMATHSSTVPWKLTWMEEPGRLHGVGCM